MLLDCQRLLQAYCIGSNGKSKAKNRRVNKSSGVALGKSYLQAGLIALGGWSVGRPSVHLGRPVLRSGSIPVVGHFEAAGFEIREHIEHAPNRRGVVVRP